MTDLTINPIIRLGNHLYPGRRLFFFIPAFVLFLNASNLYYPLNSHFYEEVIEGTGFVIVLFGLCLRLWMSGSSRRTVIRKKGVVRQYIRSSGSYRFLRNPYFFADFMIILGLSVPLISPVLFLLSISIFLLLYLPIVFSRETILQQQSPKEYKDYCQKVRLVVPSFKNVEKKWPKFRWLFALSKEGNLLATIGVLYFCMELFREYSIREDWFIHPIWLALVIPFFILCILLRFFDRTMQDFPDNPWRDVD